MRKTTINPHDYRVNKRTAHLIPLYCYLYRDQKRQGSKGEGFLIHLPTGIQVPAFMYAKHQNIYYAYWRGKLKTVQ